MKILLTVCIVCLVGAAAFGCGDEATRPDAGGDDRWPIDPNSMNLAVLVSDYLTYEFEMGTLDCYPPCASCDEDSLPFDVIYHPPGDFGDITFRYTETGDTLFFGTIIWMGHGGIKYPSHFSDSDEFEKVPDLPEDPTSIEYFGAYPPSYEKAFKAKADSAWQHVKTLDIVAEFAKAPYRLGIYMYPPVQGVFDPAAAKWIMFFYQGKISKFPPID